MDEDFTWFCSVPTETLESLGWYFKKNTGDRIILVLYPAKMHLDFRRDIYFLQDTQGIRIIFYLQKVKAEDMQVVSLSHALYIAVLCKLCFSERKVRKDWCVLI